MTVENLEIRDCRVRDLAAIQRIENSSFEDPYTQLVFWNLYLDPRNSFRIAEINGDLVAYYIVKRESGFAHIISLAVNSIARRKGVASKLLEDAISRVKEHPNLKGMELEVREDNSPAICLYTKFGFSKLEELQGYYGRGKNGLRMRLSFRPQE